MRGTIHQRCACPVARDVAGDIVKDQRGRSVRDHRTGCRPTWAYVFDVGRVGGKRKQQTKGGFRTRKDAQRALTEALDAFDKGAFVANGRLTVGQYLSDWLVGRASLRPTTLQAYESHVRLYLRPALRDVRMDDLRSVHVDRLFADLRQRADKPLSPATLQRVRATLNSALNDAVRKGLLRSNPARYVDLPSVPKRELDVWSIADLQRFLTFVEDDRLGPLFRLAATTGLRRGEVAGLRWEDVDLASGRLVVRQQHTQVGREILVSEPKSKAGRRTVPLDPATVETLRYHQVTQAAELALVGMSPTPSTTVFTRPDGLPLLPESIYKRFLTLVVAAGLPKIRFHGLRHTHATHALAADVSMKVVQERLVALLDGAHSRHLHPRAPLSARRGCRVDRQAAAGHSGASVSRW
jgi:integrase